jgi:hypothetical protein
MVFLAQIVAGGEHYTKGGFVMGDWWRRVKCAMGHGGGTIRRDVLGRINWQCDSCGRWSDHPVSLKTERLNTDRDLADYIARKGGKG